MTSEQGDERREAVHALEQSFSELMTVFRRFVSDAAERVSDLCFVARLTV